jgi:hypothetical protein
MAAAWQWRSTSFGAFTRTTKEARMATPAPEGRPVKVDGPIGQPDASTPAGAAEDRIKQLEIKLDIAEHLLAALLAGDAGTFVSAVEDELRDWDGYLEWLQVRAAMKARAGSVREQAEAAIRELRRHRNTIAGHLAEVRAASGEAWREQKKPLAAASAELERKVDEVLATLD